MANTVSGVLGQALDIYTLILAVRVFIQWFLDISWHREPFKILRTITDPAVNACKGVLPSVGSIDLSPILLFVALYFLARWVRTLPSPNIG